MKVAVLYTGYNNANLVRPTEVARYLKARGHVVELVDLLAFTRERLLRLADPIMYLLRRAGLPPGGVLRRMRGWADAIQRRVIEGGGFDAVICESFPHAYVLTRDLDCIKVLDCPTPYVDELAMGGETDGRTLEELREVELEIYESCTYLAFHWETYTDFIRRHVYDGDNLVVLNWGCHPREARGRFASYPRAVFIGYLGGYWVNKPLLSSLTAKGVCGIDVYGSPAPEGRYRLDYRGVAPSTDVLADYQLGLVTISDDPLRRMGFSAKHLEYISYGLPVLVPDWRERLDLIRGTVTYSEDDFPLAVERLSDEGEWSRLSDEAYAQAIELDWDRTLRGLDGMIPPT